MKKLVLLSLFLLLTPYSAYAALININTADEALLDTLPGIGPSKATAIIQYRTDHGPFARVEDIQNVSGIGPATYADIALLITVEGTAVPVTTTASTTEPTASSGGGAEFLPPPTTLSVAITPVATTLTEVPILFSAVAKGKGGAPNPSARILWSFGDGSTTEGRVVEKTYHYPGTYPVVATAHDGDMRAQALLTISVGSAEVRIAALSGEGITIANDAGTTLDLSGWRLRSGAGTFTFPEGALLLSRTEMLFANNITHLGLANTATLFYPSGALAASYTPPVQPPAVEASSQLVQSVEQASEQAPASTAVSELIPEALYVPESVAAPAPSSQELAAAGAVVPASRVEALLQSPFSWGALGVLVISAAAFILL